MDRTAPSLEFVRLCERIQEYVRKLTEIKVSRNTVRNYLSSIKRSVVVHILHNITKSIPVFQSHGSYLESGSNSYICIFNPPQRFLKYQMENTDLSFRDKDLHDDSVACIQFLTYLQPCYTEKVCTDIISNRLEFAF